MTWLRGRPAQTERFRCVPPRAGGICCVPWDVCRPAELAASAPRGFARMPVARRADYMASAIQQFADPDSLPLTRPVGDVELVNGKLEPRVDATHNADGPCDVDRAGTDPTVCQVWTAIAFGIENRR